MEHSLYNPDLVPSDYYLFPKLKEHLRRREFFEDLSKKNVFEGIALLENHWNKCVTVNVEK
jgi:hypothetical protein